MPSWLSHGAIRLVTHSIDKTLHSSSHTTTFLFPSCHIKDASITAEPVSRGCEAQARTGKLDNSRHEVKAQLHKRMYSICDDNQKTLTNLTKETNNNMLPATGTN